MDRMGLDCRPSSFRRVTRVSPGSGFSVFSPLSALPAGSCPLALSGSGKPLTQGYSSESFPSTMGMLHELLRRTERWRQSGAARGLCEAWSRRMHPVSALGDPSRQTVVGCTAAQSGFLATIRTIRDRPSRSAL